MLDEPKYWISLIVGVLIAGLAGVPLLGQFKIISFTLPAFLVVTEKILLWLVAAAGAYLLIDSFISEDDTMMWVSVIIAVIILGVAAVQILNNLKIIGFAIPFLSLTVLRVLFVIEGIGCIIAAFGNK